MTTTKINEPQSPLVCLLVTTQMMDTSNDLSNQSVLSLPHQRKMVSVLQYEAVQGMALTGKQVTQRITKTFILVKRCCTCGRTSKGLSITNCLNKTKRSMWDYVQQMERLKMAIQEKRPNQQEFLFCMTTPTLISPI